MGGDVVVVVAAVEDPGDAAAAAADDVPTGLTKYAEPGAWIPAMADLIEVELPGAEGGRQHQAPGHRREDAAVVSMRVTVEEVDEQSLTITGHRGGGQ